MSLFFFPIATYSRIPRNYRSFFWSQRRAVDHDPPHEPSNPGELASQVPQTETNKVIYPACSPEYNVRDCFHESKNSPSLANKVSRPFEERWYREARNFVAAKDRDNSVLFLIRCESKAADLDLYEVYCLREPCRAPQSSRASALEESK